MRSSRSRTGHFEVVPRDTLLARRADAVATQQVVCANRLFRDTTAGFSWGFVSQGRDAAGGCRCARGRSLRQLNDHSVRTCLLAHRRSQGASQRDTPFGIGGRVRAADWLQCLLDSFILGITVEMVKLFQVRDRCSWRNMAEIATPRIRAKACQDIPGLYGVERDVLR